MPSTKKFLAAGIGLLATAVAVAGCSSAGSNTDATDGPRTLTIVNYTGGADSRWGVAAEAFEAANPGVTVEIEVLPGDDTYDSVITSRIQGGTAPDLFQPLSSILGLVPYAEAGLLTDLSDEPWVEETYPVIQDAATYTGDTTYAFGTGFTAAGLYYNPDQFSTTGVEVPRTWDDLLAATDALNAVGTTPIALGAKDAWPIGTQALIFNASTSMTAEQADELRSGEAKFVDSSAWREVLEGFQVLIERQAFDPNTLGVTWPASAEDFANGRAAMLFQSSASLTPIRDVNPDASVAFTAFEFSENDAISIGYSDLLAVPAAAENADLAREFIRFVAEPENLKLWAESAKTFPSIPGVEVELDDALDEIAVEIEDNVDSLVEYTLRAGTTPEVRNALQSGVQGMLAGTQNIDQVLAEMDRVNG